VMSDVILMFIFLSPLMMYEPCVCVDVIVWQ
jgi:hypothetical protein